MDATTRRLVRQGEQILWVALIWAALLVGCALFAAGVAYDDSTGLRIAAAALHLNRIPK